MSEIFANSRVYFPLSATEDLQQWTVIKNIIPSGGASAAMEPGHLEVRTSSSQVTRMHFFSRKSWRPF